MVNDRDRMERLEKRWDALLAHYRANSPDPDPGPNFMPELWRKIEASQSLVLSLRRWTQGFVTAAAALCLLMLYLAVPSRQVSPVYTATYLDVLAADLSPERLAYAELVQAQYDAAESSPQ